MMSTAQFEQAVKMDRLVVNIATVVWPIPSRCRNIEHGRQMQEADEIVGFRQRI